jgi:hypothetical protein
MSVMRRLISMVLLAFVPVLTVALAPAAYAAAATPASGGFVANLSPVGSRSADGNTFITFTFVETFQGTLAGTRVGSGQLVIHPDGTINVRDSGLFTGSIAGASGTAILSASVSGTFGSVTGNFVVTNGTDGLAGVHAEGTAAGGATGPATFAGTYSGQVVTSRS